ncbi:unnamed protein product [Chrysoparadoxa australica]
MINSRRAAPSLPLETVPSRQRLESSTSLCYSNDRDSRWDEAGFAESSLKRHVQHEGNPTGESAGPAMGWEFATGGGIEEDVNNSHSVMEGHSDRSEGEEELTASRLQPQPHGDQEKQELPLPLGLCSSKDASRSIIMSFMNSHTEMHLQVAWIDYSGTIKLCNILEPGESCLEVSFATHPWILRAVRRDAMQPQGQGQERVPGEGECLTLRLGLASVSNLSGYSLLWDPGRSSVSLMQQAKVNVVPAEGTVLSDSCAARTRKIKLLQQVRQSQTLPAYADPDPISSKGTGQGVPHIRVNVMGGTSPWNASNQQ